MLSGIVEERLSKPEDSITLEFSSDILGISSQEIVEANIKLGDKWHLLVCWCATCYGHNKDKPIHVEILES